MAEDALRLNNRVAQLRKEEEKAVRRIAETKKRSLQVTAARRRNARAKREKSQWVAQQESQLKMIQAHLRRKRSERQANKVDSRTSLFFSSQKTKPLASLYNADVLQAAVVTRLAEAKARAVEEVKLERQRAEIEVTLHRERDRAKAVDNKEGLRYRHEEVRNREENERRRRAAEARAALDLRIQEVFCCIPIYLL